MTKLVRMETAGTDDKILVVDEDVSEESVIHMIMTALEQDCPVTIGDWSEGEVVGFMVVRDKNALEYLTNIKKATKTLKREKQLERILRNQSEKKQK